MRRCRAGEYRTDSRPGHSWRRHLSARGTAPQATEDPQPGFQRQTPPGARPRVHRYIEEGTRQRCFRANYSYAAALPTNCRRRPWKRWGSRPRCVALASCAGTHRCRWPRLLLQRPGRRRARICSGHQALRVSAAIPRKMLPYVKDWGTARLRRALFAAVPWVHVKNVLRATDMMWK